MPQRFGNLFFLQTLTGALWATFDQLERRGDGGLKFLALVNNRWKQPRTVTLCRLRPQRNFGKEQDLPPDAIFSFSHCNLPHTYAHFVPLTHYGHLSYWLTEVRLFSLDGSTYLKIKRRLITLWVSGGSVCVSPLCVLSSHLGIWAMVPAGLVRTGKKFWGWIPGQEIRSNL